MSPLVHKVARLIVPWHTRSWAFNVSSSKIFTISVLVGSKTSILVFWFQTGSLPPLLCVLVLNFYNPILISANGSIFPNISVSLSNLASINSISRQPLLETFLLGELYCSYFYGVICCPYLLGVLCCVYFYGVLCCTYLLGVLCYPYLLGGLYCPFLLGLLYNSFLFGELLSLNCKFLFACVNSAITLSFYSISVFMISSFSCSSLMSFSIFSLNSVNVSFAPAYASSYLFQRRS